MNKKRISLVVAMMVISTIVLAGCGGSSSTSNFIGDQVDYQIIGIEPGAGLMMATEKVLTEYALEGWDVIEGSSTAMTAALDKAYKEKKPIIVTGWTPHWKFSKYDLKYLADPKKVYGEDEKIHTIVRSGLKEAEPTAYTFLDRFYWEPADMESIMVKIMEGATPEEASAEWVESNPDKVNPWIEGLTPVSGNKMKLAYVAWDSEIASTNVVKVVLEKLGYSVEMLQVDAGPMWLGVSNGDADAMVAAWLPSTHEVYFTDYEGKFEDLGENLVGTKLGLVVPSYVEINSIEDLKK